jgi:phosphatidylglycerol:prolipoprotein diacylglycerol transferase
MHRTLFQIGPIGINAYSAMLTLAFFVGTILAVQRAKSRGVAAHDVVRLATLAIVASIAGARLLYGLEHVRVFATAPGDILLLWQGGLSYHGGLFAAVLAAWLWFRVKRIPVGKMVDIFAPSIALGFGIVRIGCFLNGCCFGTPTDMPWGLNFPLISPAGRVFGSAPIHPVQLYASICGLLGFLVLIWIEKKYPFGAGNGLLFLSCLALSSSWRFLLEFFRYQEPQAWTAGGFTPAQVYCLGLIVLSVIAVWWICTKSSATVRSSRNGPAILRPMIGRQ